MINDETISLEAKLRADAMFPDAEPELKEFAESLLRVGMWVGASMEMDNKIAKHKRTERWLNVCLGVNLLYALLFLYWGT